MKKRSIYESYSLYSNSVEKYEVDDVNISILADVFGSVTNYVGKAIKSGLNKFRK